MVITSVSALKGRGVRILLAAAIPLAAGVGACAARRDLAAYHDTGGGRLCEVTVGMPREGLANGRVVIRTPEGVEEERLVVPLCGGAIEAELTFRKSRRVDSIVLSQAGICLHGLCIGDRYGRSRTMPAVVPFIAGEEGGIVSLLSAEIGVAYSFELEDLPAACLRSRPPCAEIDRLKLGAIIVGSPAAGRAPQSRAAAPH